MSICASANNYINIKRGIHVAKSQILKDLVTNKTDLESILSRLKVIFMDIGDQTLLSWIDGELMGFNGDDIPKYRIIKGIAKGTFF